MNKDKNSILVSKHRQHVIKNIKNDKKQENQRFIETRHTYSNVSANSLTQKMDV